MTFAPEPAPTLCPLRVARPHAITMWDFSWLERRWPGAGYEDWGRALDELVERGYDAVRIDPYPHLLAERPEGEWDLEVLWTQQDWGSPAPTRVCVWPALADFIRACAERGVKVALSSWFRADGTQRRLVLDTPEKLAEAWAITLRLLEREGLLGAILFVDLCNEWPGHHWAPFFRNDPPEATFGGWHTERSRAYMKAAIAPLRAEFPQLPLTFSFTFKNPPGHEHDLSYLDLFEPHLWMANNATNDFYNEVGYRYELTDPKGYNNLQVHAERAYRARPEFWHGILLGLIESHAEISRRRRRPLVTTECWGPVDYKDWPLLDWGWVKEVCALGTRSASSTGRWAAIATSNFCGPQFRGMWRDVAWHQRLTREIKAGQAPGPDA
jgi:sugar phosphate isomerase/epimerase